MGKLIGQAASRGHGEPRSTRHGERVGIKDVTSHVLPYTYPTELLRAGVDIVTVADLMGHASIEITRTYTRASEVDLASAVLASAVEKLYAERSTDKT